MSIVTIARQPSTASGTFGTLSIDTSDFTCISLELPWLDNQTDLSCIPTGTYICTWRFSPSHGRNVYHIENVSGRTSCEIHPANVIQQLLGCICLGTEVVQFPPGTFSGISIPTQGVQHSQATVAAFESIMNQQTFTLIISNR